MPALLATYGRVVGSPAGAWDWWPLAGIALVLVGAGLSLHLRLNLWVVAAAVAAGPLFATAVHAWGAPIAVAAGILALVTVAALRPEARLTRPERPTLSDIDRDGSRVARYRLARGGPPHGRGGASWLRNARWVRSRTARSGPTTSRSGG